MKNEPFKQVFPILLPNFLQVCIFIRDSTLFFGGYNYILYFWTLAILFKNVGLKMWVQTYATFNY